MEQKLINIYKKILRMSYEKKLSHIGSNFSVAPILYEIYKKKKPEDIVILSKGHAAAALYSVLLEFGITDEETINKNFCFHITTKIPGVYFSTGSLGHGLPIAIGCATANPEKNIYVVLSDGEMQEGSTLEAIEYLKYLDSPLRNLFIHIDYNKYSATKPIDESLPDNYHPKFEDNPNYLKFFGYYWFHLSRKDDFLPPSFSGLISHYKKIINEEELEGCLSIFKAYENNNSESAQCEKS